MTARPDGLHGARVPRSHPWNQGGQGRVHARRPPDQDTDTEELPWHVRSPDQSCSPGDRRTPPGRQGELPAWQRYEGEDVPSRITALPAHTPRPVGDEIAEGEGALLFKTRRRRSLRRSD